MDMRKHRLISEFDGLRLDVRKWFQTGSGELFRYHTVWQNIKNDMKNL